MKHLVIFLLFSHVGYSQTNHYKYNSAGVPEKIGYSEPANNTPAYSPYKGIDLDLYTEIGLAKQKAYNDNVSKVQNVINETGDAIKLLRKVDENAANKIDKEYLSAIDMLNKNKYDYSNNNITDKILMLFNSYKNIANEYLLEALDKRKN